MREKSDEEKMALESEDGGELNFSYKKNLSLATMSCLK